MKTIVLSICIPSKFLFFSLGLAYYIGQIREGMFVLILLDTFRYSLVRRPFLFEWFSFWVQNKGHQAVRFCRTGALFFLAFSEHPQIVFIRAEQVWPDCHCLNMSCCAKEHSQKHCSSRYKGDRMLVLAPSFVSFTHTSLPKMQNLNQILNWYYLK